MIHYSLGRIRRPAKKPTVAGLVGRTTPRSWRLRTAVYVSVAADRSGCLRPLASGWKATRCPGPLTTLERDGLDEPGNAAPGRVVQLGRSEEHTSELQSRQCLVCRLLLENMRKPASTPPSSGARPRSPRRSASSLLA